MGATMSKPRHTALILRVLRVQTSTDVLSISAGGPRNSGCISGAKIVSALQMRFLWRTPYTYTTFTRAYGSAFETTKREIRVSDEDDDDASGEEHIEDDDDVEDEQYIEDDDDDDDEEEEEEEEEGQVMQSQAPVKKKIQAKPPKSKAADRESRILNQNITAKIVRLVNEGEGHRIVSREEALALAKDKNMDLVLVDGRSNPPVCKIFDFHKEEYRQEQVKKDRKKKKGAMGKLNEMKELRFNTKTEPKDLKMKVEKAKQFMDRGYRVKFVANLKGSYDDEKKKQEQEKMINAIYSLVEDIAVIEQGPRLETRHAWLVLRHVKFGQNRKKTPKDKLKICATEEVDNMKDEFQLHGEPDYSEGHEEKNMQPVQSSFPALPELNTTSVWGTSPSKVAGSSMQPSSPLPFTPMPQSEGHEEKNMQPVQNSALRKLNTTSVWGTSPVGRSQGYPSKVAGPSSPLPCTPMPQGGVQGLQVALPRGFPPQAHEADCPHVQPPPLPDLDGFRAPGMQRPPSQAYPQHTPSLQGFGGLRDSETVVSPPQVPPLFTPRLQGVGGQDPRMQSSPPDGFPRHAHEASHSHGQPPLSQDSDGLIPGMQLPRRGFPQHTSSPQGFGGVRGSEAYGFQRDGQSYQQNQASQGYPIQRSFSQTGPAQEAYSPQGDGPQSQVSQGFPPKREFLQTRPVAPPVPPPRSSQGYPLQQNQASQGYPLQRAFPQTGPQEAFSPQGDGPQSEASQGYPPQRGFLQTRPVVPPVPPPWSSQGYPIQQNQASQGYPLQRGFPQTGPAQEAFSPQGDGPQSQASQGYPAQRGFLQTQPVVPPVPPPWSSQGYPLQQNQASRGYPVQRGFPQTGPAQEAYSPQGDGLQSRASQGYPPQRGFLQTRPVAPPVPPPQYSPSWSKPQPQCQEYSPLFEPPSEKS